MIVKSRIFKCQYLHSRGEAFVKVLNFIHELCLALNETIRDFIEDSTVRVVKACSLETSSLPCFT